MMKYILLFVCLLVPIPAMAQPAVPATQYRVTRTGPGTTINTMILARAGFTCNVLAENIPIGPGINFTDEDNPGRVCYIATNGIWTGLQPGIRYAFTLAAAGPESHWSPESEPPLILGVPTAPSGFGLRPGFAGIAMLGTVEQRFPFAGLDVVQNRLDSGELIHVGMLSLGVPGFVIRPGDRIQVAAWRQDEH